MKNKLVLASIVILCGCSVANNLRHVVYNTHGKSDAQFERDKEICKYETDKIFANNSEVAVALSGWADMFHECLESRGYTPQ